MHPSDDSRLHSRLPLGRLVAAGALALAALTVPWSVTVASAAPGDQSIVSLDENGDPAFGGYGTISADGRYVVFDTWDSLVASDTNTASDVYVRDRQAGVTRLASVTAAGTVGNLQSTSADISDDGNLVVFASSANNLVPDDSNGITDIFIHNFATGETSLVSRRSNGALAAEGSSTPLISGDGRFVTFGSVAALMPADTNEREDAYRVDLVTGQLDLVSQLADGSAGSGWPSGISRDGMAVVYETSAAYVSVDTNGSTRDVYVHDYAADEVQLASVGANGESGDGLSAWAEISADGRYVTFTTAATSFGNPDNDPYNVVWRDRQTGQTRIVSETTDGEPEDEWSGHSSISSNGRYVAFHTSSTNLAPAPDSRPWSQVFVRDMRTGAIVLASTTTSGELPDSNAELPSISADGRFVMFYGANSHLVGSGGFRGATYVHEIDFPAVTTPDVAIDSGPAGPTAQPDPTFTFSSSADDATFECSLATAGDVDHFEACTSPASFSDVADGGYVFKVRAARGELTSDPATKSFSIDTAGPIVSLEGGPPAVTNDNTPTFPFSAEPGTTFTCSLTRDNDDFVPCTSPITYPPQDDGVVTFKVLGTDALGNTGLLTQYTFTIDASEPTVELISAPEEVSDDNTPTFAFESGTDATFECRISLGVHPFTACTSPVTYGPLPDDTYTFAVRATDAAGNVGPILTSSFTIDTTDPLAAPSTPDLAPASDTGTSNTDNITTDTTPTFTGTAPAGATVTVMVDGDPNGTAIATTNGTYTITTGAVAVGQHTITARASDGTQTSETSSALNIQITPPPTACETATNTITGTATSNTLTGGRLADRILGLGGNDTLDGKANNDCLFGGTGNDQLRGGVGNDELNGDDGTDTLTLGDGVDVAAGGAGNDRITSRDTVADRVDCGTGTADVVIADNLDVVVNCETVRRG